VVTKRSCHRLRRSLMASSFICLDCNESLDESEKGFPTDKLVVCETLQRLHKIDRTFKVFAVHSSEREGCIAFRYDRSWCRKVLGIELSPFGSTS
jgi:hypothetical protein